MFPHFLIILYCKNFFVARNVNYAHFYNILKHSCRLHVKTCCRHAKRRCSFLEDVAFTPCFLSLARRLKKLYLHFQFRAGAGLPHTATGQQPAPYRGMVLGKSHFDFSMLVFSADSPTAERSRRKRAKTADAAEVIPHAEKAKKKGGFPRPDYSISRFSATIPL